MTKYKLKKNYRDGDFVGWRVVDVREIKMLNKVIDGDFVIADFYGKGAKEAAKFLILHLIGKEMVG